METESRQLIPFAFGDHLARVLADEEGNPWFVAKDVCRILEIEKYRDAASRLDEDERGSEIVDTPGGPQPMATISESGLYALVFRSRKPEAKAFSKWVRSKVLPAIRKTGRYEGCAKKALPEEMPESALALKPAMRQRLWRDALDTARLGCGGVELAMFWFDRLCRLMAAQAMVPPAVSPLVAEFFNECCIKSPGSRIGAAKLYEAMRQWLKGRSEEMPSMKSFGESMRRLGRCVRSNGTYYLDLALR